MICWCFSIFSSFFFLWVIPALVVLFFWAEGAVWLKACGSVWWIRNIFFGVFLCSFIDFLFLFFCFCEKNAAACFILHLSFYLCWMVQLEVRSKRHLSLSTMIMKLLSCEAAFVQLQSGVRVRKALYVEFKDISGVFLCLLCAHRENNILSQSTRSGQTVPVVYFFYLTFIYTFWTHDVYFIVPTHGLALEYNGKIQKTKSHYDIMLLSWQNST